MRHCSRISCFLLLLVWMLAGCHAPVRAGTLQILRVAPEPNYKTTRYLWTPGMLTDGRISSGAIWVKPGALTWQDVGAVAIDCTVPGARGRVGGLLQLHFGCSARSGVGLPSRIDVYGLEGAAYVHLGGVTGRPRSASGAAWIGIPLRYAPARLLVVILPSTHFLSLDEVTLRPAGPGPYAAHELVGSRSRALADSRQRLKDSWQSHAGAPAALKTAWRARFGTRLAVWQVADKYGDLTAFPPAETVNVAPLEVDAAADELETACLGILNPRPEAGRCSVAVPGKLRGAVSLCRLIPVTAAGGRTVFDAVAPLERGGLTIPPFRAAYVWVRIDARRLGPGVTQVPVLFSEPGGGTTRTVLSVRVFPVRLAAGPRPHALLWSYSTDKPVFTTNKAAALRQLLDFGVDVFTIPPVLMPGQDARGGLTKTQGFEADLDRYRGKGQVLLFMNWVRTAPADIPRWSAAVTRLMRKHGYAEKDWAFYPIDEPGVEGGRVERLAAVVQRIKAGSPGARIYCDPNESRSKKIGAGDLARLVSLSDIVQPLPSIFEEHAGILRGARELWMYSVPPSPAKTASPGRQYRALGWLAAGAGATGVGVWSYSDSSGASAWDDLAGRRPGYAMAYEDPHGGPPLFSRRLEAFRDGLEDFRLVGLARKVLGLAEAGRLCRGDVHSAAVVRRCRLAMLQALSMRR